MASPQCPAPTTMADVFSMVSLLLPVACSGHVDGDGGGVGEDVVDRRAFLRLRDKGFDLFRGCVGVDLVAHPDTGEAIADLGIGAQDSMEILVGLDGCLHRAQLNLAMLGDRGDASRQAAAQRDQHILDRGDAVVLRGERERMVDVMGERRLVMLLLAESVESVHG